jgi:hypothetical protein
VRGGKLDRRVAVQRKIGLISFSGTDGSTYRVAARIRCEVDGTPASAQMPARLIFQTYRGQRSAGPMRVEFYSRRRDRPALKAQMERRLPIDRRCAADHHRGGRLALRSQIHS